MIERSLLFISPCVNCTKIYLKGQGLLKVKLKSYHGRIDENSIFTLF